MAERATSRFNLKRIAYVLKTTIHPYTTSTGEAAYGVKTEKRDTSSSLGWSDTALAGRFTIPGNATMTTHTNAVTFTGESGASVTRYADGSMVYSASPTSPVSQGERLRREQASRPWWEKDREAIESEYIYETGRVLADPVYGESKQKGTPYRHFKLTLPVSETDEKAFDVYAYGQALSLVNRRNIHKDDMVRVRASVQFHEQRQSGGRTVPVPWLNLFDIQKVK